MPKMKSHRGAGKRFWKTGTGLFRHQKKGKRHILTKKDSKRKRQLRRIGTFSSRESRRLKELLPYE